MGVVFVVLTLLALSIKALSLFDSDPAIDAEAEPAGTAAVSLGSITEQQVAAIGVALAVSESESLSIPRPTIGTATGSAANTGTWLQAGRIRMLRSNMPVPAARPRGHRQ